MRGPDTRLELLREALRSPGAREASWSAPDGASLRLWNAPAQPGRPSWRPRGPGSGGEGLLRWGPRRCGRDPHLAAAGIRALHGWLTPCGGTLLVGGGAHLHCAAGELSLRARALAALGGAGGAGGELERLGLAAAGVAHDLRNLVALAQLELEALAADEPGTRIALAGTLRDAGELAHAFLGAGPTDAPRTGRRTRTCELGPVLRRSADRAERLARVPRGCADVSVPIEVECAEQVFVVGGAEPLARVFDNLLANAVTAARRAAGAAGAARPIRCRARRDGGRVRVEVHDRGRGFSAGDLQRLLAPGRSGCGGTGFGTASVRECLQRVGGSFEVHSRPGAGTTCRVWLEPAPRPDASVVLVVAADPLPRAAWVSALAARGVEACGAATAGGALAWAREVSLGTVLWVRGVPGGDGANEDRAALEALARERGRSWLELAVRGAWPRMPTPAAIEAVRARLPGERGG